MDVKKRKLINRIYKFNIIFLSLLTILPLLLILLYLFKQGVAVLNIDLLTKVSRPVGERGGALNSMVGTLIISTVSVLIAAPVGILSGLLISEYAESPLAKVFEISVKLISGIPSIVIGIVTYIWLVKPFRSYSALAGSVALSIMILPSIITGTAETIKLIPRELKEAGLALGSDYGNVMLKIVIPIALPGIMSGLLVGFGRIVGETAPLLFTAFGNPYLNFNILKPMNTLSLLIYNYALSPYKEWHQIAWGASILLIFIVFTLNMLSRRFMK
jgi:phosphate transport system permease protein